MPQLKLDHVVIAVSNREASNAFYERVLGAEIVSPMAEVGPMVGALSPAEQTMAEAFRVYRFGSVQLNVHGPETNVSPSLLARAPVRPGGSDLCFEWEGPIEAAEAHLRACEVTIVAGPMAAGGRSGSGTSIYFRDPDGTLLEFISYVKE